jgi:cytochrome c-type biogenesis protein
MAKEKMRKIGFLLSLILILMIGAISYCGAQTPAENSAVIAPDFTATDLDGRTFNLSDFRGEPLVLHITNIEIPLCRECETHLKDQVKELAALKAADPNVQIVTLNLRKNPYSRDGHSLAEGWWKVNITWPWIEDIEPYSVGSKYLDYWNVRGGASNPTILLINKDGKIAGIYHVYRVGEGEVDGVQTAETLSKKLQDLKGSQWKGLEGEISQQNVTALGMFILGIVTSLAPCSIALMIAVFSYVMTVRRKDEYLRKSTSTSKEGFMMGIAFTLGMAAVFFVLGLFISQVGLLIRDARVFDLAAGKGRKSDSEIRQNLHRPLQIFRLHRCLLAGGLLCPWLGSLRSIHGFTGTHLAGIAKRHASDGRYDALRLRSRAWRSHHPHQHILAHRGRKDRG